MKSITVSVDDETCRHLQVGAARSGTSVSVLTPRHLKSLVSENPEGVDACDRSKDDECARRRRLLSEVLSDSDARGVGLSMADNLSRDALLDRDAFR